MSNIYYISFEYTAISDFEMRIYFNAEHNDDQIIPSTEFKNRTIILKCHKGEDQTFSEKNAYIDIDLYNELKIYDKLHYDIIINLIAFKQNGSLECELATYCKIIPETKGDKTVYKIKPEQQKLKIKNNWYEMHDVYGFPLDNSS